MSLEILSDETVITMTVFASAFFSVLAVWYGLIAKNPMRGRIKVLARRRDELKGAMMGPVRRSKPERALSLMRRAVQRLDLLRGKLASDAEKSLTKAGWRSADALIVYLVAKLALPVLLAGAAFGLIFLAGLGALEAMPRILALVAAAALGLFLPDWVVRYQAGKRRKAMQRALPDALDLLVICVEAGLGLDAALVRVSGELGGGAPELADELKLTAMELGFLPDRKTALANLLVRTDLPALRGVINTLVQTEKYGTPLANALRVLSGEYRDERMMRAEEKAAKLPATLTTPMIVFILPTLFIVLLGPAAIRTIDALSGM